MSDYIHIPSISLPMKKEFTWPVWGNIGQFHLSEKSILGATAMWAIALSPYTYPKNLEKAIESFRKQLNLEMRFTEGTILVTIEELRQYLVDAYKSNYYISEWNEPVRERTLKEIFSVEYEKHPDTGFISLDALARNVSHTCGMEHFYWIGDIK